MPINRPEIDDITRRFIVHVVHSSHDVVRLIIALVGVRTDMLYGVPVTVKVVWSHALLMS